MDPEAQSDSAKKNFGARLRSIRERYAWSQETLADSLGVNQGTLSRWETGKWRNTLQRKTEMGEGWWTESISRQTLFVFATIANCSIEHLCKANPATPDEEFHPRWRTQEQVRRCLVVLEKLGLIKWPKNEQIPESSAMELSLLSALDWALKGDALPIPSNLPPRQISAKQVVEWLRRKLREEPWGTGSGGISIPQTTTPEILLDTTTQDNPRRSADPCVRLVSVEELPDIRLARDLVKKRTKNA